MANYEDKLKQRLDELIQSGEEVLATRRKGAGYGGPALVEPMQFSDWKTGSLSLLDSALGSEGVHFRQFNEGCKLPHYQDAAIGLGVLKAAKADLEGGYLKRFEDLVSADIFTDFLEMADYLLAQSYKDPAASLGGAVLEDGLRRIARRHEVTLKTKENISSLNQKVADRQIYTRLVQKQIEVWNELRDKADHALFDQYNDQQVNDMLAGIRTFLAQHL